MKAIYIIPVIVFAAALYLLLIKSETNETFPVLPEAFTGYQSIDSLQTIQSGTAVLDLLFESRENIQSFLTKEYNVIIYTVQGKTENTFYKIAPNGDIIDTLKINHRAADLAFVKGFIIDKERNEYYKWTFNGNKTAIKLRVENAGLDWDTGRQETRLAQIKDLPGKVYVDYRYKSPAPSKTAAGGIQATDAMINFAVLTFFHDDDCFQFYTTLDMHKQFPWSYTRQLLWNNLFKQIDEGTAHDGKIIPATAVRHRYFHRLKKEEVRFSGGGGNAPGFTSVLYPGYLFSDIEFQKDTLRIKQFMYLNLERPASSIKIDGQQVGAFSGNKEQPIEYIDGYMYYTHPKLQYALFANSDKKLYQIREVSKRP